MIKAVRIKLNPTKEQEQLFFKSAGVARWSFNFFLGESEKIYKEEKRTVSESEIRKLINNELKPTTHLWLNEVSSNVMKQAVKDANEARSRWFKKISEKPKFKKKFKTKPSFYVNYESLKKTNLGFKGEKLGEVKTFQPLPKLAKGKKYSNPRISYDGRNWFLAIGCEIKPLEIEHTCESKGIDVGIKSLAVCSDGKVYKNINKTKEVKRLEKKLKREQRKTSAKLRKNTSHYIKTAKGRKPVYKRPLNECQNIQKQFKKVNVLYKRLTDIRDNHLHQATNEIVKTKPFQIVVETLNIKGMMKNKHLAKALSEQKLYEFKRQLRYKCELNNIQFIEADMWFPSSKTCSCCNNMKIDLKLKDRTFKCTCGFTIDRDLNAAINLANYSI